MKITSRTSFRVRIVRSSEPMLRRTKCLWNDSKKQRQECLSVRLKLQGSIKGISEQTRSNMRIRNLVGAVITRYFTPNTKDYQSHIWQCSN